MDKLKSILFAAGLLLLILAAAVGCLSIKYLSAILPADSYEDKGVYTFSPYQVLPAQVQNAGAGGRDRRMNPTKTAYMVYYRDNSGSDYQWSEQAVARELGQKIVDAGTTIERRVLSIPADHSYIIVESGRTAEKVHHRPCIGRGLCPAICDSMVCDRRHKKENEADMKGKSVHGVFSLCCAAGVVLLLTGCDPTAGATEYEVIYPSGYSRDCGTYDEESPIEGSSCCLQWKKAEDYRETYNYDLRILDENGSVLYIYPDVGSEVMRGSVQEDDKTWVCAEHWTAPHHNGYVEGWLKESDLFLIDLSNGKILFQDKAEENEFYITSNETRCYFYVPGREESEKLFGLLKIPAENAMIYYRDISDWTQKHTFYTFDYVEEPDIDTSNGVLTRIKFYISENQLKVAWTSYESIGDGNWEYLEKTAYEIPLTENAPE